MGEALDRVEVGDCRAILPTLPAETFRMCVTSPPYWGLRDYGVDGQIGLEPTPEAFVASMVAVFREVRRVLAEDGTLWLNLGDSYASTSTYNAPRTSGGEFGRVEAPRQPNAGIPAGLKPKDLIGMPWRVAFALQADGWYLRSDIIWAKPNPMPESVMDRPTKSHEYVFLLSKSERYFYDADAIRSPLAPKTETTFGCTRRSKGGDALGKVKADNLSRDVPLRAPRLGEDGDPAGANARSVWNIGTKPYAGMHFATFPPGLVRPCILAGSALGDAVLDPFMGSGTVGQVAEQEGRRWFGCELNPAYGELAAARTAQVGLKF